MLYIEFGFQMKTLLIIHFIEIDTEFYVLQTESFIPEASEKHTYGLFTVHAPQEKTISNGFSEIFLSIVKQVIK